jgi:hypothetical protein
VFSAMPAYDRQKGSVCGNWVYPPPSWKANYLALRGAVRRWRHLNLSSSKSYPLVRRRIHV